MKRNKIFGLVVVVLGGAVLSSTAWAGDRRNPTVNTAVVTAGTGVGSMQTVATQIRFSNNNNGRRSFSGNNNFNGSAVLSGSNFRGSNFRGGRGFGNNNNGGNVTVVYPDNGYGDYNNAGYLGYPPWYRLNYYTPWMSDYDNGTAGQNVPSSHANRGYGIPDPVAENMSSPGPEAANVDYVVAVQRELRNRGFYRGVVNGMSDAPTRAAIRSFETSMGMPVTGIIGFPLLRSLGFF